tara:strand:+ start:275 stop:553 length:279 start_codon:yes stop_codon:yes gene_type:complete
MFFKPKVYKHEGETVALKLSSKISSLGVQSFLANAESYVEEGLQSIGTFKSTSSQKKQICQLAIRFHEHDISYSNNKEMIPNLRDQILTDLL